MRAAVLMVMLVLAAFTMTGCEAIEGIFKAGVWVGVVGVALVLGIIAFVAVKVRGS
jgi:hypothetical protein